MSSLEGLRIGLTRSTEGNAEWMDGVRAWGGEPIDWPCSRITALDLDVAALRRAHDRAHWLAFTSARAVRFFAQHLGPSACQSKSIACVGERTAQAIRALGAQADLVAPDGTAHSLGQELVRATASRDTTLILAARDGRRDLQDHLRQGHRELEEFALYATLPDSPRAGESLPHLDALLFASPSAVRGFHEHWTLPENSTCLSIGPTTSATLKELGLSCDGEARERSLSGLLDSLERVRTTDTSVLNPTATNDE